MDCDEAVTDGERPFDRLDFPPSNRTAGNKVVEALHFSWALRASRFHHDREADRDQVDEGDGVPVCEAKAAV